jgi:hypothetical protein
MLLQSPLNCIIILFGHSLRFWRTEGHFLS